MDFITHVLTLPCRSSKEAGKSQEEPFTKMMAGELGVTCGGRQEAQNLKCSPNYALKTIPGLIPWSHGVQCHLFQDLEFWPTVCHFSLLGPESILACFLLLSGVQVPPWRDEGRELCVKRQGCSSQPFYNKGLRSSEILCRHKRPIRLCLNPVSAC